MDLWYFEKEATQKAKEVKDKAVSKVSKPGPSMPEPKKPVSKPLSVPDLAEDPEHQAQVEALRAEIFSNLKELQRNIADSNKVFDFYDKKHDEDDGKKKAVEEKGRELKEMEAATRAKLSGKAFPVKEEKKEAVLPRTNARIIATILARVNHVLYIDRRK